jgi:pseudouridine-5'-phosphate glycosidase
MPAWILLGVREDVRAALADGRPVVALEPSVIAHGLPSPVNVRVAHSLGDAVRVAGAIPATVGVIAGRLQVGLEPEEIERLGGAGEILKCAAGDLGWAITQGADGATTVSATVFAAASVGIDVVATGGIGGVHRGIRVTSRQICSPWLTIRSPWSRCGTSSVGT